MNHEVGRCRNNDSSTLPSGFNCCEIGVGVRVSTQPGPGAVIGRDEVCRHEVHRKPGIWRTLRIG
jgi:hypothetical protein